MKELLDLAESKGMKLPIFKWDDESLYYYALCYVQKWLRDEFNIHVWYKYEEKGYFCYIGADELDGWYEDPKEALKIGIFKALKDVK